MVWFSFSTRLRYLEPTTLSTTSIHNHDHNTRQLEEEKAYYAKAQVIPEGYLKFESYSRQVIYSSSKDSKI